MARGWGIYIASLVLCMHACISVLPTSAYSPLYRFPIITIIHSVRTLFSTRMFIFTVITPYPRRRRKMTAPNPLAIAHTLIP